MNVNNLTTKLKSFFAESRRVLQVTHKPNGIEFKTIVKVSGLGIAIIGIIGFLIRMGKLLIFNR